MRVQVGAGVRPFVSIFFISITIAESFAWADLDPSAWRISSSYSDVRQFLKDLSKSYPKNAKLVALGSTDSGQPIEALRLGSGPVKNLVVATHHGNEYGATEVAKAFAAALARDPIPKQTLYVVPVLNIGGYDRRSRHERDYRGRSYDPNRNYPGPCGTEGPFTLKSTRALADFVEREGIVASATLHTYSPAVVYPWGISSRDLSTPYDSIFRQLAELATIESGYTVGNSTEIMYPADGTFEDYAFWRYGVWSMLFELGDSHGPTEFEIREMIERNLPGLRRMFENAPTARAIDHSFKGKCDALMRNLDRHIE